MTPHVCIKQVLLALKVSLISHQEASHLIISIGFSLIQPFPNVGEGLAVGEVVDQDHTDRSSVVTASNGLESLLTGLDSSSHTVSQICNLTGRSPIVTILEPNSTPIVVS